MAPSGNQEEVTLFITDEGQGIPLEMLDKLGTPFLTTKDTGTGLGLAICYNIASRHNALIHVETEVGELLLWLHSKYKSKL